MNNIDEALKKLNVTGYSLDFIPSNEEEFLESFSKIIYNDDEESTFERVSRDPKDFGVTWDDIVAESNLCKLRKVRNSLLEETDWVTLRSLSTGNPIPNEVLTYQQELRDITNTYSLLENIEWPTKPPLLD